LAAGCTVVLKPSEVAPLNAFMLADIVHEVGLPKGVFNLVSGYGPVVGEVLIAVTPACAPLAAISIHAAMADETARLRKVK
jgi:acyl-CoA reductase-like NAD-dependent aldehyde dehydrogenase